MRSVGILPLIGLVVCLGACAPAAEEPVEQTTTTEADAEAIKKLHQEAVAAFNAGDLDALMAFWTDDPVYMPAGVPAVHGKEKIRDFYTEFKAQANVLSSEEVVIAGEWAFERGTFSGAITPKEGSEPVQVSGKFLDIWQRQSDGSWKIARAIWNLDNPLPAGQ
ncbi:DUF4440 domain-containing protein [Acidobacteria bacterium AH-259-O06]|nr:DUF4440 domain-containing protein [Acidobacteria bacterium AH-259-O06]